MRKCKNEGGSTPKKSQETPESGAREWEADEKDKPSRYNNSKVEDEAEEKKSGGKAKKKKGGVVAKNVGGVVGSAPKASAARAPRKSGGRTGSDRNPLSSAHSGTKPKGHSDMEID